ncbi:hypothetical protein PIB30_097087, partial [Stylosanthes scabra]|nr:hypothetical protein [Stylosanthes scabra]
MVKAPLFIDVENHWYVCTEASGVYALVPKPAFGRAAQGYGAHALALWCVCIGSSNGLLGFACDLLALFSYFRFELRLLKPEILECTHQGIVRN